MTARNLQDRTVLNNGVGMPWLGLGVWQGKPQDGPEVEHAVRTALDVGYRQIDTAAGYENEVGVGKAIRVSGIPREEIFVTTKVRNSDHGYESTLRAFDESRRKLGLDYLDLYLIHWPIRGRFKDTWRAFEKLYEDGAVRAIGVSNFQVYHLEDLLRDAQVVPAVNQVEYHPLLTQQAVKAYCEGHNIQMEAWSPLMKGHLEHATLTEIAARSGRSSAQILLRWDLQQGVVTIPKSIREQRIRENADVFDFVLSDADMGKIDALNQNRRFGQNPDDV